jgi:hypothetical protein
VGFILDGRVKETSMLGNESDENPREAPEASEKVARPPAPPRPPIKRGVLVWALLAAIVVGLLLGWLTYAVGSPGTVRRSPTAVSTDCPVQGGLYCLRASGQGGEHDGAV